MTTKSASIRIAMLTFVAILSMPFPASLAQEKKTAPRQILLIRHAEKPPDEKMSVSLSPAGHKRAHALRELFKKSSSRPHPFPTPDFIFAAKNSKHSHRALETVTPLAKHLDLKVNADFTNEEYASLATEILKNPKYAGKTILICWHHGKILALAKKLKVTETPGHWNSSVFDRVWQITYASSGKTTFKDLPQHLLPADSKK